MSTDPSNFSSGAAFRAWRESYDLTQQQLAERMQVTRTTIQNWEGSTGTLPPAATMSAGILDARLKQESPLRGPLTLIYADGPMFVDPYGPRRSPATMQQEPYPSNVMALARVEALWGRDDFCNPFIMEKDGSSLWNVVELSRVAGGADTEAPTLLNLLRKTAAAIRENAHLFVRTGPRSLPPEDVKQREAAIKAEADTLEALAASGLETAVDSHEQIEAAFKRLLGLGTRAPDGLVSAIHHALEIFRRSWGPRVERPNFIIDYRGYQISWLRVPLMTASIAVDVSAEIRSMFAKIDRRRFPLMALNAEAGVREAKAYIDSIL